MSDFLWNRTGLDSPDSEVMTFLAGEDVELDRTLLLFDLQASAAHARGLVLIGILTEDEGEQVRQAIERLAEECHAGTRLLDSQFEDGHSAIETWLTEMLGPLGEKIHTGRSRNDQVAVALRLCMRHQLELLSGLCGRIAEACLVRAEQDQDIAIPGHTHLQKAMPSSAGLWLAGHAEAFIDNCAFARDVGRRIDASPLGTASGFGVNLPLPREEVASELGFSRLVVNPQYAQNSRGKVELMALSALATATLDLRRLAWDLSLFSSDEFCYLRLPERYCTGSSIMPNKRNPDVVELLRATHAVVQGAQVELGEVLALPSGYHRDLQATKPPFLRAFARGLQALSLVPRLISDFDWNPARLEASFNADMFATDRATERAKEGVPFRQAYREVAESLAEEQDFDVARSLEKRVSPGATGALMLDVLRERLAAVQAAPAK
ncbi:MAG: argininosuccinate lyase [Xanthomonadales bacterium]|nr:argininosuccinate lyase [Xanthomonadales bacterium]